MQHVIGAVSVYYKFIPKFSNMRIPLKESVPWNWIKICWKFPAKLKSTVICKLLLNLFNPKSACHDFVNALTVAPNAVIKQPDDISTLYPITHYSI